MFDRYTPEYGPGASSPHGPQSRPFHFWMREAEHAVYHWHADATGNAIGWAARAERPVTLKDSA